MPEDFPPEPGTTFHQGDTGNSRASELRTFCSQVPRGRNSERVRCSMVRVVFTSLVVFFCLFKERNSNLVNVFVVEAICDSEFNLVFFKPIITQNLLA